MIERLFAAHMFAKHSFGVKYLGTPLRNPSRKGPGRRQPSIASGCVTPPEETDSHDRSFRPRPADHLPPPHRRRSPLTPMQRPVLAIVPARDEAPAEVAPLAAVYRLPVADQANVYRRRRLAALAIVAGLVLGVVSFMQQADATPTPKASSPSRSASSCSPATPCGVSQVPWHRRVIPEHSSTSSAILPVDPRFSLASSSWCRSTGSTEPSDHARTYRANSALSCSSRRSSRRSAGIVASLPLTMRLEPPPTRWGEIESRVRR